MVVTVIQESQLHCVIFGRALLVDMKQLWGVLESGQQLISFKIVKVIVALCGTVQKIHWGVYGSPLTKKGHTVTLLLQ